MDGKTRPRSLIVTVFALVLAIGAIGIGVASAQTTGDTFTGCLKGGTLTKVAIGSEPVSQCSSSATEVSWNETGTPGVTTCVGFYPLDGNSAGNLDNQNTTYSSLIDSLMPTTTTTNGQEEIHCDGYIDGLFVVLSGTPGANTSYIFTVMVNGVATNLSCAIGSSFDVCDDDKLIPVSAGDFVNIEIDVLNGPTVRTAAWLSDFLTNPGDTAIGP